MSALNSALVLGQLVSKYQADYGAQLKRTPSLREISDQLGLDPSSLAKWTSADAPINRRIPLRQVPRVAEGLRLTQSEVDALMEARLAEEGDASEAGQACLWLADFLDRLAPKQSADEAWLLSLLRPLSESHPLGFDQTPERRARIQAFLAEELRGSQADHLAELGAEAESPAATATIEKAKAQIARRAPSRLDKVALYKSALRRAKAGASG